MSAARHERLLLEITGTELAPAELPREGLLVIGTSPKRAGLVVDGQGVAEVHCAIGRTKGGTWAVKDLGSEYGTLVNGVRVERARLEPGDLLLLGSRRLKVIDPNAGTNDAPPPADATPAAPAPSAPAPSAAPAATSRRMRAPEIQGYRIEAPLGRGAMGAVFLAEQVSLARQVALKVLPGRLAQDRDFVERFQAEARAAAALNHQNVVTVFDVGQAGEHHYLSMEYMDKGSLEERVANEGPLHWRQVLDVLHDAASGLIYAESRGIVHRDIKPANLMQNHHGTTKIADLGLATQAEGDVAEEGERKIFGTPHFISPEQISGEKADCRSDLYSLGATAYRLLSGHTPFEGSSTREILRAKLREDPRPLREFVDELPPEVEQLVARLMKRDPGERYPSASTLLRDIEEIKGAASARAAVGAATSGGGAKKLLLVGLPLLLVGIGVLVGTGALGGGDDPVEPRDPGAVATGGSAGTEAGTRPGTGTDEVVGAPTDAGPDTPPVDDDAAERLFELEAENALLHLNQRDMPPAERRDALRELARTYQGTSVATKATEEADTIAEQIRVTEAAAAERETKLGGMMSALRAAAALDQPPIHPARSLRAMYAVNGQVELEIDDGFLSARAALEDEVTRAAITELERDLARADELERSGSFGEMRELLNDVLGRTELPDFSDHRTPEGAERILTIRRDVRETMKGFGAIEAEYQAERARADARAVARGFGGHLGLEAELRALDFEAAAARLKSLEQGVATPELTAWIAALRADVEAAKAAVPTLIGSWSSWRRKSVTDPRGRAGTREAQSIGPDGLQLEGGESLPWSAFGGKVRELDNLFQSRLSREYNAEEERSIAALMRLESVISAIDQCVEMLEPGGGANFSTGELQTLSRTFGEARSWAQDAGTVAELEREERAVQRLGDALRQASEGSWAAAVAGLEQLFQDHGDTLLVRLLSDGAGFAALIESPSSADDGGPTEDEPETGPPQENSSSGQAGARDGDEDR